MKERYYRNRKKTLEKDNKNGTCPDQTLEKIKTLAKELGRAPSPKEYRSRYNGNGGYSVVTRHFGTWKNAMRMAGLKPAGIEYTREYLLELLRNFYKQYGRTPMTSDFRSNPELPSDSPYRRMFGHMNMARLEAGIPIVVQEGFLSRQVDPNTLTPEQLSWYLNK